MGFRELRSSGHGTIQHTPSRHDEPSRQTVPVKLWIDADAAPVAVKEICYRASDRLQIETILVANQRLLLPPGYAFLQSVRVNGSADAADRYIAEQAVAGDVAVTQDIPLAAVVVPSASGPAHQYPTP